MNELIIFSGVVFMGFFAIMNPIANFPIFLTLTAYEPEEKIKEIAFRAVITAFCVAFLFALAGHYILSLFSISLTALRLAGGIIVGIMGYEMLQGHRSPVHRPSNDTIQKSIEEEIEVAYTPLGTPLLAGPGVIITTMNFASYGIQNMIITVIAFALLCVITYYSFIYGRKLQKVFGTSALRVTTRMMGLILAVIGMQMFIHGIYSAIKEFPIS